jgi:hypothetical protein
MCGIVGYIGNGEAYPILDCADIALKNNIGDLDVYKAKKRCHINVCPIYFSSEHLFSLLLFYSLHLYSASSATQRGVGAVSCCADAGRTGFLKGTKRRFR